MSPVYLTDVPRDSTADRMPKGQAVPAVTRKLLELFFQIHDPTTLNRQGSEEGRSVRSAVFFASEEQRRTALDTIADVNASGLWPGAVVTEVVAAGPFWPAEEDDQNYLQKHPDGETCHFIRPDWKLPHRSSQSDETGLISPNPH